MKLLSNNICTSLLLEIFVINLQEGKNALKLLILEKDKPSVSFSCELEKYA